MRRKGCSIECILIRNQNKLAQQSLKRKIKSVVSSCCLNGYLAFENYWNILYLLHITQNIGKSDEGIIHSERIKRVKKEKDSAELEFALQLWNKINWYLFTYVEATVLIDFLMILLSNSKRKVTTAEKYLLEISQAEGLSLEEIEMNKERNSELVVSNIWSVDELFNFYKIKLNWPAIVARTGLGIENNQRKQRLYNEHYKEWTFRPQVSQKVREAEEKKISMNKINQSLDAFNVDQNELDANIMIDKTSKNLSAQKSSSKRGILNF